MCKAHSFIALLHFSIIYIIFNLVISLQMAPTFFSLILFPNLVTTFQTVQNFIQTFYEVTYFRITSTDAHLTLEFF